MSFSRSASWRFIAMLIAIGPPCAKKGGPIVYVRLPARSQPVDVKNALSVSQLSHQ
ncbi:Hypothetical protein Cul210931_1229 [Corynebacterium ulcerans]|nr:Hypothetical protein Cul210931_1229 [Corynebacterium ulcerans]